LVPAWCSVSAAADLDWEALTHYPAYALDGATLDDFELLVGGVPDPVRIFVPPAELSAARDAGGLVFTDQEGTPLALLTYAALREAGEAAVVIRPETVQLLRSPSHGPFRALRLPAREVRRGGPYRAVVFRTVPTSLDAERVRSFVGNAPGLVVALIGAPVDVDAPGLVRAVRSLAAELRLRVVAIPGRVERLRSVLAAYGIAEFLEIEAVRTSAEQAALSSGDAAALPAYSMRELRRLRPEPHRRGAVVLFTGLSGSGKSTLARGLVDALEEIGDRSVTLLDGDEVRRLLSAGLGFSKADRDLNVRRIGYVASLVAKHGGIAVCAPIAPYADSRAAVRTMAQAVGEFVLVHVSTPLHVCEARDRKGLYARARAGVLPQFTGVSDPYEPPTDAALQIDTSQVEVDSAVGLVVDELHRRGLVPSAS
jgi:sulfate adenylyltransferase